MKRRVSLCADFLTESELQAVGFKKVGKHCRVHSQALICNPQQISLGNYVRIDAFTVILPVEPVIFGDYNHLGNFCYLGGRYGIFLDDFVAISHGVKIYSNNDDYLGHKLAFGGGVPKEYCGGPHGLVTIKKHTIIGSNSVVLPNLTIGEGCAIGALSLVNRSLEPWGIYGGVPVRRLKDRPKQEMLLLEDQLRMNEMARQMYGVT